MTPAGPTVIQFACPSCNAQYEFPTTMSGKRGKCAACGTSFQVPVAKPAARQPMPQYIGVECHLCGTRMYGGPDLIGKQLKCPDCGARTVLPPPPPPKEKNVPAAMYGEQYELWEPEVPASKEMLAHQPKFIAVACSRCGTLMYAKESQVGEKVSCPDCGRKEVVPAPPKPKAKVSPLVSDAEMPALDPASAPTQRPSAVSPEVRRKIYEEERDSEYGRALEKARRTGKPMEIDVRGRRIMPRRPLVTGVWRMIFTEEVIARWVLASLVLGFAGQLLGEALLTPLQGMAEAIKLVFTVLGGMLLALWFALTAPFIVAMVGESASGDDRVHQPPRLLAFDWFGEVFGVFSATSLAGLAGLGMSLLLALTPLPRVATVAIVAATVILIFPFALLSTLLDGSPFAVVSGRLLKSLGRCAGSWLLYYVQTFALAAIVGAALVGLSVRLQPGGGVSTTLVWIIAPIATAALFISIRLLGRLGWVISERMPPDEEG